VIVDCDRENLLGALLPDHVLVEHVLDLAWLGQRSTAAPRILAIDFLGDDVVAQPDALVADINRGPRNELLDLLLRLSAEGALQVPVTVFSAAVNHSCVSLSLKSCSHSV